jgi:hypothetical protein
MDERFQNHHEIWTKEIFNPTSEYIRKIEEVRQNHFFEWENNNIEFSVL